MARAIKMQYGLNVAKIAIYIIMSYTLFLNTCHAETASWYSVESCKREGTSGIMANGKEFKDEELTCASWDYPFGTVLKVTNFDNGLSVEVVVTDRGPAKRLVKEGRTIDLSKGAFRKIASLEQGLIPCKVEVIE